MKIISSQSLNFHWIKCILKNIIDNVMKKFIGDNNIKLISYKELSNE